MKWQPAPFIGGAYRDDARSFSAQDTVNWIPERAEAPGGRAEWMLRDAPGMHVLCDLGTNAPIRGLHNCEGRLLAVSGTQLFNVGADYVATSVGTIPGTSRVSIDHNQITGGNEALIANGASGYVYNTVAETVAQITDVSYPGATVVTYLNQVLVQIDPTRRIWFHSDVTQATQYLSTDEYEAEAAPDLLVTLIASHGQLIVFGDRTAEFYANVDGGSSFFQRMEGTTLEVGCAAPHAISRLDATVYWVGSDGCGYRLNGLSPQRITTHAIEQAWRRCDRKKAFCMTFEDEGHKIWYVTFPDGETWGYDVATGEWHRRKSASLNRWRLNALVFWNDQWIGGDFSNGKLYRLDWDYKMEACEPLERERISGVLHDNQNRVGVNGAEFVFETGGPESEAHGGASVSGSAPNVLVGDVVDFQYTVTPAYPGQQVTLVVSGDFPDGWSLSNTGHVTGATTATPGTHTWSISTVDDCGNVGTHVDNATVTDTIVSAILEDAPILYWKHNETSGTNVVDYSGFGRHGTITGSPTLSSSGITLTAFAQGVYYPGAMPGSVLDVAGDTSWALMAVITRSGTGGSGHEHIAGQWRSPNFGYYNTLLALVGTGGGPNAGKPFGGFVDSVALTPLSAIGTAAIANSVRTVLMIVRDPGSGGLGALRMYANGVEVANNTTFASAKVGTQSNGAKFLVGVDSDAAAYFPNSYGFLGKIEHVAVYDTAITAARALYHAQILGLA